MKRGYEPRGPVHDSYMGTPFAAVKGEAHHDVGDRLNKASAATR